MVERTSPYEDVVTRADLARALRAGRVPVVTRGARLASGAAATHFVRSGTLRASGRAFVRAYGGVVHASGTATVLAEEGARVEADEHAIVILASGFGGSVRVGGAARCVLPRPPSDVRSFCRLNRLDVTGDEIPVWGLGEPRAVAGDAADYRVLVGRRRPPEALVAVDDLELSGSGGSLCTRGGGTITVKMTEARRVRDAWPLEVEIAGRSRRTVDGPARVRVGGAARVVVRGPAAVTAWGTAHVEAIAGANVVALEAARVVARGRSFVRAFDAASVDARDEAVVFASEYARVVARDEARVEAELWAVVEANDRARVRAFDASTVFAGAATSVEAAGYAIVRAALGARVVAGPEVIRMRQGA